MIRKIQVIALVLIVTALGLSRFQYHKAVAQLEAANEKIITIENSLNETEDKLIECQNELEKTNAIIGDLKSDEYELVYMGEYKISYYCDERYSHICGGSGKTASGKPTNVGITAAGDWSVLPKGSIIYIENIGWREIQDKGGAVNGKHIDVLVGLHQEANRLGKDQEDVWLLVKK
jgi:3D (Asp-Asp-Asp) domain-containing protein